MDDQHILEAVLDLPAGRRAVIAEKIYDSFSSDEKLKASCIEEAETRLDAYYRGGIKTFPPTRC